MHFCSRALPICLQRSNTKVRNIQKNPSSVHKQEEKHGLYLSFRRLFVMKRGNMDHPLCRVINFCLTCLAWVPCYSHPQVGSPGEASDLLLLRERQECPAGSFTCVQVCSQVEPLCVQVVMEPRTCLGLPTPLSVAQSHPLGEGKALAPVNSDLTWTLKSLAWSWSSLPPQNDCFFSWLSNQ